MIKVRLSRHSRDMAAVDRVTPLYLGMFGAVQGPESPKLESEVIIAPLGLICCTSAEKGWVRGGKLIFIPKPKL